MENEERKPEQEGVKRETEGGTTTERDAQKVKAAGQLAEALESSVGGKLDDSDLIKISEQNANKVEVIELRKDLTEKMFEKAGYKKGDKIKFVQGSRAGEPIVREGIIKGFFNLDFQGGKDTMGVKIETQEFMLFGSADPNAKKDKEGRYPAENLVRVDQVII